MRFGKRLSCFSAGIVVAACSLPALAQDDEDVDSKAETTAKEATKSESGTESHAASNDVSAKSDADDTKYLHGGQFSLRMGFVAAYRIVSRYDSSPYCENPVPANPSDRKKFCGFGAPPALDFALGYAPFSGFEPFGWARLGLAGESETDTKPLIGLGFGARLYTSNDGPFKFFIQPAVGWELEKGQGHANWRTTEYKQDMLIQLLAGPQYDFSRVIGAYAAAGVTAGIFRAIQSWMELDIGIQVRMPN